MYKVLCPGEALIDFVAVEALGDLSLSNKFEKKAGGAPANAAGAMQKFGVEAYFMGAVGNDPFGEFLKRELDKHNINTKFMHLIDNVPTTLAFVSLTKDGERDFVFNRGADAKLTLVEPAVLAEFDCMHFASATAFLGDELEKTYNQILEYALANNKLVTFDANYREALFGDQKELFINNCLHYIKHSDIVKLSEEEAVLLTSNPDIIEAGTMLQRLNNKYVLITRGARGTSLFSPEGHTYIDTTPVQMVDSTGAGDAYIGTVVALATQAETLSVEKMIEIVKIANRVGALTTQNYGALESIPTLSKLDLSSL